MANVHQSFIGNRTIIRATQDLEPNTEVMCLYTTEGRGFENYQDRQKRLDNWGFTCDCALCEDAKTTSEAVLRKRQVLVEEFAS